MLQPGVFSVERAEKAIKLTIAPPKDILEGSKLRLLAIAHAAAYHYVVFGFTSDRSDRSPNV
jgi:hypothetical protein